MLGISCKLGTVVSIVLTEPIISYIIKKIQNNIKKFRDEGFY